MFTGIITDIGTIKEHRESGDAIYRISHHYDADTIQLGASIACDGCCLTVIAREANWFEVQVSKETLSKTNLGKWNTGSRINLERALKVGDELGGHIVTGHVDGLAQAVSIEPIGGSHIVWLESTDHRLSRFIAPKGSITLNGVSLTVNEVNGNRFNVNIIPHTWEVTTFGHLKAGDYINLEIDLLARYMARMLEK
jgi:riboflavin synthase